MLFRIYEYIKYWFKAKGLHGIHSPFITHFIKHVIHQKIDAETQHIIGTYHSFLGANQEVIQIKDYGQGSKILKEKRTVSQMFHLVSTPKKYGNILFNLSRYFQSNSVLEFGTALGVGTLYLSSGNPSSRVYTIEGCPNTLAFTQSHFPRPNNVKFIASTFEDFFEKSILDFKYLDILFIDGNHNGEALLKYVAMLEPKMNDQSVLILDDIRWNKNMLNAWNQLISMDKFHVSIDLFKMGILIKRQNQQKEHFILKV